MGGTDTPAGQSALADFCALFYPSHRRSLSPPFFPPSLSLSHIHIHTQSGPKASLYLTLVGILAGFMSTFWNLGYQRTSARMQVRPQQQQTAHSVLGEGWGPRCGGGMGRDGRQECCQVLFSVGGCCFGGGLTLVPEQVLCGPRPAVHPCLPRHPPTHPNTPQEYLDGVSVAKVKKQQVRAATAAAAANTGTTAATTTTSSSTRRTSIASCSRSQSRCFAQPLWTSRNPLKAIPLYHPSPQPSTLTHTHSPPSLPLLPPPPPPL